MEAITRIANSEDEAEKIIVRANQKAKTIVSAAEEEAKKAYEEAIGASLAKSKELCEAAKVEAARQSKEFSKKVEKECDELYAGTRDRIDGAVQFVVEKVVNGL